MKKVFNAKDSFEAGNICAMLEEAGIPSYYQESGSGEYLKITSGINPYGTDIFVNDGDETKAKILLDQYQQESAPEEKGSELRIPWYKNKTILARIMLVFAAIMVIIIIISSL